MGLLLGLVPLASFAQFTADGPVAAGSFVAGRSTGVTQLSTLSFTNTQPAAITIMFDSKFKLTVSGSTTTSYGSVSVTSANVTGSGAVSISQDKKSVTVSAGATVTVKATSSGTATPPTAGDATLEGSIDGFRTYAPDPITAIGTSFYTVGQPEIVGPPIKQN